VVRKRSSSDYVETAKLLVDAIERHGLTVFARVDHAAGARAAGLELADEQVIVFGSPQSGTPLMQSDPQIGIELPLRMLVWREGDDVLLGYRDPRELGGTYNVGQHQAILGQMAALLEKLANEAASEPSV
jgi:uncharacterized protein (DUF302 family)